MQTPVGKLPQKTLFTPGPVMTPDAVQEAVDAPAIGHRRPEFEGVLNSVRDQLRRLYRATEDYTTVVVSGSGTAANEMVISSLHSLTPLVITNGEFGERLTWMMDIHQMDYQTLEYDWGEYPNPDDVKATLAANPDIDMVAMTYQETSTGMINPVSAVGDICAEFDCYLYADAISAIGGEDIDVATENIAVATGVANKAVGGLTGASFVCIRDDLLAEATDSRTRYLDLTRHVRYADERSQTPNTPAVTSIIGLDAALSVLLEDEGLAERIDRYDRCSSYLRETLSKLDGIDILLTPEQSSNTIVSAFLPEDISLTRFIDDLADRGYLIYPGKGPLYDRGMVQVSTMGEIYFDDCCQFVDVFEAVLDDHRV